MYEVKTNGEKKLKSNILMDVSCLVALFLDGGWTSWTNYSACSVPMGHGTKYQTRECTNPEPCGVLAQHCVGANSSGADCEGYFIILARFINNHK